MKEKDWIKGVGESMGHEGRFGDFWLRVGSAEFILINELFRVDEAEDIKQNAQGIRIIDESQRRDESLWRTVYFQKLSEPGNLGIVGH